MTAAAEPDAYATAWKALPRRDRAELTQAALRGAKSANRWDAALTLWWTQRELRYGLRRDIGVSVAVAIALVIYASVRNGVAPTSIGDVFAANPLLPVIVFIPVAGSTMRRPRVKRAAQINAGVLAGKAYDAPPDAEEAQRLLQRARSKGWLRGPRPER